MKILHLTLKKQWFDYIEQLYKQEEYREIKPYWEKRLMNDDGTFKEFDIVKFKNGYSKQARIMEFEFIKTYIGAGYEQWGAPHDKNVFIIKLGKKL